MAAVVACLGDAMPLLNLEMLNEIYKVCQPWKLFPRVDPATSLWTKHDVWMAESLMELIDCW